jgi:hypothetical protein
MFVARKFKFVCPLAGILSLSLLGCDATALSSPHPTFGLARLADVVQVAGTPTDKDTAGTTIIAPGHESLGQVTISFTRVLPARGLHVLSTLAEVDHVTVTLVPASGVTQTVTVAKAAIAAGLVVANFTGVAVGQASYSVAVFDAANTTIGAATGQVGVVAGISTSVVATIALNPTRVPPVAPPAGGGTGNPPPVTTGSVTAALTLQDGQVAQALALDSAIAAPGGHLLAMLPDGAGNFWASANRLSLVHFSRTGVLLGTFGQVVSGAYFEKLGLGLGGQVIAKSEGLMPASHSQILRMAANGATVNQTTLPALNGEQPVMAVTTTGDAWTASATDYVVAHADGSQASYPGLGLPIDMVADHQGGIASLDVVWQSSTRVVVKMNGNGTVAWSHSSDGTLNDPRGIAVDANNNVWVVTRGGGYSLLKYAPDGTLLGHFPLPGDLGEFGCNSGASEITRVLVGPAGDIYLLFNGGFSGPHDVCYVLKVGNDGVTKSLSYLPEFAPPGHRYVMDYDLDGGQDLMISPNTDATDPKNLYFYKLP